MKKKSSFIQVFEKKDQESIPVHFLLLRNVDYFRSSSKRIKSSFHKSNRYIVGAIHKPVSNLI